jgi:hypothetical protein
MAVIYKSRSEWDSYVSDATKSGNPAVNANLVQSVYTGEQIIGNQNVKLSQGWNGITGTKTKNPDGSVSYDKNSDTACYGVPQMSNANLRSLAFGVVGKAPINGGSWKSKDPVIQAQLDDQLHKYADNPKIAVQLTKAYLDNEVPGIKTILSANGCQNASSQDIGAIVGGSYNLGAGVNANVIKMSIINGKFDRNAYYQNYFNNLKGADQTQGNVDRVKRAGGDLALGQKGPAMAATKGPMQGHVETGRAATMTADQSFLSTTGQPYATSEMPDTVIHDGLDDVEPWWDDTDLVDTPTTLMGTPAWFEIKLNQSDSKSLSSNNGPVQIKLNVSLSEVQESMAHVINNKHSRTGFHVTLWGQEPDIISASGSTGLFMNWFGLTDIMSRRDNINSTDLADAFLNERLLSDEYMMAVDEEDQPLRVAAQEAFSEILQLFQNNGITRYHPEILNRIFPNNQSKPGSQVVGAASTVSDSAPMNPWAKSIGSSLTQATNRPNDVMSRGYVVFKYKNRQFLGYFKDIHFEMDANNPFRWNFGFTFQVERSLSTFYYLDPSDPFINGNGVGTFI